VKVILILLCGLIFSFSAFGQAGQPTGDEVAVDTISLARDNGSGKAGEETDIFFTRDIPIYCIVRLNSLKPATVKMNLVAVKVAGVKPETKVITVSYKTSGNQNRVNFTGKPEGIWTPGMYRIDVFIDGKPAGNRDFEIQKAPQDVEQDKLQKQTPPQSTQKPKTARRYRKN
jgi:hypothetical protein